MPYDNEKAPPNLSITGADPTPPSAYATAGRHGSDKDDTTVYMTDPTGPDGSWKPHAGEREAGHGAGVYHEEELETQRSLKPRQISMIAIGGAIGTGLVIGSGTSLARSGPGSIFIAYVIMGMV